MSKEKNEKFFSNNNKEKILNKIGEIYSYTEENLSKPIKPSDLRVILEHNYNFEQKINEFKIDFKNYSFYPERDLNKNEKLYKIRSEHLSVLNEHSKKGISDNKIIDLTPQIKKGEKIEFNHFDFFQINEEGKKIKYEFKERNKNDFFIVSKKCNVNLLAKIKGYIDFLDQIECYLEKIGIIYLIFILKNTSEYELYNKLTKSKIDYFYTNPKKFQIVCLLNELNDYKPINIFNTFNKTDYYYFLVNQSNEIICLKSFLNFNDDIIKFLNENKSENKKENNYELELDLIANLRKYKKKPYLHTFKFNYKMQLKVNDDLSMIIPEKVKNIKIEGEFRTNEYNYLINLNNKFQAINLKELETFSLKPNFSNLVCSNCKKKIKENEGIYYCYWCNILFCEDCFESKLTENHYNENPINFKYRLIHKEHNLIYFKTRNILDLENLDKSKLGNNKFNNANPSKISYKHSAICNGCRHSGLNNNDKKLRYICISCRPGKKISGGFVDYCFNCFNNMRLGNERGIDIQNTIDNSVANINKKIVHKHNHNTHIYCVLTCEVDGKYEDF